jgi:hypothetical protein
MNLTALLSSVRPETARAFVTATWSVIQAVRAELDESAQRRTPAGRDYRERSLSRTAPAGGWLTDEELCKTAEALAEAIAAEKWTDGLITALKLLSALGGVL